MHTFPILFPNSASGAVEVCINRQEMHTSHEGKAARERLRGEGRNPERGGGMEGSLVGRKVAGTEGFTDFAGVEL